MTTTKRRSPLPESIEISEGGELVQLPDHPTVGVDAIADHPAFTTPSAGVVQVVGIVAGQSVTATYTIRGVSLDGEKYALTRRY